MKVGTDALLLGSWSDVSDARQIIDAGTGSGIAALMAAQRAPRAEVTGVELEPNVAEAQANRNRSPWSIACELLKIPFRPLRQSLRIKEHSTHF